MIEILILFMFLMLPFAVIGGIVGFCKGVWQVHKQQQAEQHRREMWRDLGRLNP